jgi:hypothetical protein
VDSIDFATLEDMMRDPRVPDAQIRPYLTGAPGAGSAFDPRVVPDPARVRMDDRDRFRVESAVRWGNQISRWRRHRDFERRRAEGEALPVLVSEGDSWFQFPFLIDDVVDHLGRDHLVWSLDAAGDRAQNMVIGRPEYLAGLNARRADRPAAFLFSAAGNDVIGEDETGRPMLTRLVKPFAPGKDAAWHVDQGRLSTVLTFLDACYRQVIDNVRADPDFARLPILVHGYDYAFPHGVPGDRRSPEWARDDQWLGRAFAERGVWDHEMRRGILRILIDGLYDMLHGVAGDPARTGVHVVDVRGTLTSVDDWADEIHGTSAGFARVADRFRATLRAAGVGA